MPVLTTEVFIVLLRGITRAFPCPPGEPKSEGKKNKQKIKNKTEMKKE